MAVWGEPLASWAASLSGRYRASSKTPCQAVPSCEFNCRPRHGLALRAGSSLARWPTGQVVVVSGQKAGLRAGLPGLGLHGWEYLLLLGAGNSTRCWTCGLTVLAQDEQHSCC